MTIAHKVWILNANCIAPTLHIFTAENHVVQEPLPDAPSSSAVESSAAMSHNSHSLPVKAHELQPKGMWLWTTACVADLFFSRWTHIWWWLTLLIAVLELTGTPHMIIASSRAAKISQYCIRDNLLEFVTCHCLKMDSITIFIVLATILNLWLKTSILRNKYCDTKIIYCFVCILGDLECI